MTSDRFQAFFSEVEDVSLNVKILEKNIIFYDLKNLMWIFAHSFPQICLALRNKIYGNLREIIFNTSDSILGDKYIQGSKT